MKYSNLKAFENYIAESSLDEIAHLHMILIKDSFQRKLALDKLMALFAARKDSFNIKIFDAANANINELIDDLNSLSLFSQKQVIVLNQADELTAKDRTKIEPFLASPVASVYFVITAEAVNHATNFYKKAEKNGVVLELAEEKPWEKEKSLVEWLQGELKNAGKRMDSRTCLHLVKQTGMDQATLYNELEKLVCYVDERDEITIKDIGALCVSVNTETVWQLGEALFTSDANSALRITKGLLNDGAQFLGLLRQVRNQFQTEFQVCSMLATGGSSADVSQKFPYMRGAILDRHMRMAQEYGLTRFKQAMQAIDEAELLAKNSFSDHDFLAEMLVMKLALPIKGKA